MTRTERRRVATEIRVRTPDWTASLWIHRGVSGTAFLVSELADFAVYTPLRAKGWTRAVVASNLVGLTLDSVLFLSLAFGSLDYLAGQLVGKAWMTALAVGVYGLLARRPRRALAG